MNEAQVWAVIFILGAAMLMLLAERLLARLVKLWVGEAALRAVKQFFRMLREADSKAAAAISETPHLHQEQPPRKAIWRWGPHGPGCRCRGLRGVVQA